MKKWLLFLLKLLLTGACLGWAVSRADWSDFDSGDLRWSWVLPGLLLAGGSVALTAFRLKLLLAAQDIPLTFRRALVLTLIGDCFNLVSVASIGGDAVKIFLLVRDHPGRKLAVTMTVLFDHLVGLVAMALVFFLFTAGRFQTAGPRSLDTEMILGFAWVYFGGGLALIGLMFVLSYPPVHARIHRGRRTPRIAFIRQIPEIFDIYRSKWPHALLALLAALVMLPVYYATFWCGARAVGSEVGVLSVLAAMPVVDMLSALPVSVSGLGVREVAMKILMEDLTGMAPGVAIAGSLIGFSFSLAWALVGGLLFLRPSDRVSVKQIERPDESPAE